MCYETDSAIVTICARILVDGARLGEMAIGEVQERIRSEQDIKERRTEENAARKKREHDEDLEYLMDDEEEEEVADTELTQDGQQDITEGMGSSTGSCPAFHDIVCFSESLRAREC